MVVSTRAFTRSFRFSTIFRHRFPGFPHSPSNHFILPFPPLFVSVQNLTFLTPMEDSSHSSPIIFSGADDAFLAPDPSSQIGSYQSDGLLSGSGNSSDAEFGFQRAEMGKDSLVGTVQIYDRHVFLCYKTPQVWPPHVDDTDFDRLPRLLSAALVARKGDMKKRTRLTVCEGEDGTESSNGDVLIFPDMIRYRQLTHFDVDNFVEEVLVKDKVWLPGAVETLRGSYVFVCAHGSRDRRCGVCGPVLIKKFKEEINSRNLQCQVSVSPCSHIGGHKYAGNVIIFGTNINGEVAGHWYGYVTPDDVSLLLERHIGEGEIVEHLWRGQMGLTGEDQKKTQNLRLQLNAARTEGKGAKESIEAMGTDSVMNRTTTYAAGCCQGIGNSTCCQNMPKKEKLENNHMGKQETQKNVEKKSNKESKASGSKGACSRKFSALPTWYESWEREDTYAALSVVVAIASVAVAYRCYKQL